MIGVTLFGIFLTPVFFAVVRRLSGPEQRVKETAPTVFPVSGGSRPTTDSDGPPELRQGTGDRARR
jgi:hypothetical protein